MAPAINRFGDRGCLNQQKALHGCGVEKKGTMERIKNGSARVETLKELAELLKTETDRWSRQVILAEAAQELAEIEAALRGPESNAVGSSVAAMARAVKRAS